MLAPIAALVLALGAGCGGGGDAAPAEPGASEATVGPSEFAVRQLDVVLTIGCGDCHDATMRSGGLSFSGLPAEEMREVLLSGRSQAAPGERIVAPGDPDASFLVRKLRGDYGGITCAGGDCGARMPIGNYPFAEGDRIDIEDWIAGGAKLALRA
ncbi:MAG TPA: hypothetical protein VFS43_38935 [Polyangiaceae bacterium]|nr:hypothetical protein [Polyangiaceae bacterium]